VLPVSSAILYVTHHPSHLLPTTSHFNRHNQAYSTRINTIELLNNLSKIIRTSHFQHSGFVLNSPTATMVVSEQWLTLDYRLQQLQRLRSDLETIVPLHVVLFTLTLYIAMSLGEKLLTRGYGVSRYWVSVVVAIDFLVLCFRSNKFGPLLFIAALVAGLPLHHVLLWLFDYNLFRCLAVVALANSTYCWANRSDRFGDFYDIVGVMGLIIVFSVTIAFVMRAEQLSSQNGRMAKLGTAFFASGLIIVRLSLRDANSVWTGHLHLY
jgi:hypothetical protein